MSREERPELHGRVVRAEIEIAASPERVWEAWADPEAIACWFVDGAEGEGRAGELMKWKWEHFGYEIPVPVLESEPGERFVTGGEMPGRLPYRMEVHLESVDGRTKLRLMNSGFGEDESADFEFEGVRSGWTLALATLKHWLEHHDGQPRHQAFAMRPLAFEEARIAALYRSEAERASWFDAGALDPDGSRLLAHSDWEFLFARPEDSGVLSLKAFEKPPEGRHVGLHFSGWGEAGERAAERWRGAFPGLLERLAAAYGDA